MKAAFEALGRRDQAGIERVFLVPPFPKDEDDPPSN